MRRAIALTCLMLALVLASCTPAKKVTSEKSLIKCTTCGVEFTAGEGMEAYEAAHGH